MHTHTLTLCTLVTGWWLCVASELGGATTEERGVEVFEEEFVGEEDEEEEELEDSGVDIACLASW